MYVYAAFKEIFSSIGGHLGCFHLLALLNNASMNTGAQSSLVSEVGFLFLFFVFEISGQL